MEEDETRGTCSTHARIKKCLQKFSKQTRRDAACVIVGLDCKMIGEIVGFRCG